MKKINLKWTILIVLLILANIYRHTDELKCSSSTFSFNMFPENTDDFSYPSFEEVSPIIERFKETAQNEQLKFDIPASITLAQLILESSWGTHPLAKNHNNFFCVKYYSVNRIPKELRNHVDGYTIVHDDCSKFHKNIKASEIESYKKKHYHINKHRMFACKSPDFFVKYDRAWASFRHHSLILLKDRYMKYNPKEYNDWAYALQKGGYATNPKYATQLINIVHKYKLHQYDKI